ncbi:MAG: hypothetical protein C0621_04320 [Desulfuromonas sp.]|nr:MAG: hypothetical protein C0621_04320 [Desulfuromonas sp.]
MKTRNLLLALLLILMTPLVAPAEEPQVYVVKEGDTLWGISQKFMKDPYYWPSLWANNPAISNPHFIYPGQTLHIYDGRIEIVPVAPEPVTPPPAPEPEPEVVEVPPPPAPVEPPAEPMPVHTYKLTTPGIGFITAEELDVVGRIVDSTDNRILLTEGDTAFVSVPDLSMLSLGEEFSIFNLGEAVSHPVTQQPFGFRYENVGTLEIRSINAEVATAVVTDASREIQRGHYLRPFQDAINSVKEAHTDKEISGNIVTAQDNRAIYSEKDVVYIDKGSDDGLVRGNRLRVFRPRQATDRALLGQGKGPVLPDVEMGDAIVIETLPHSASILILTVHDPIYPGDQFATITF